jgi:hypothetical protein
MAALDGCLYPSQPPNQTNNRIVLLLLREQGETKADKEIVGWFRSGRFPTINTEIHM